MYPHRSATSEALRRFFSGLTEHAFQTRLGVADPQLIDYLGELLTRFVRTDDNFAIRNLFGRRLNAVADMWAEAEARVGEAKRQVHRHIGDFTLFWSGVYPEALAHFQRGPSKDFFIDYCAHGKRAYYIASTIPVSDGDDENAVLQRLSHDFDLCVYGLGEVRREWERRDRDGESPGRPFMIE